MRFFLWPLLLQVVFVTYLQAESAPLSKDIRLVSSFEHNERSTDYLLSSEFLPYPMTVRVTLPENYSARPDISYPVIYFLHGGAADHRQWADLGLEEISEGLDVILVQPFGGRGSWYRDARYGSLGSRIQWESYFIHSLIPWVDTNFRSKARAEQRAIMGLSMGGYGATAIAARYPDYFASVSSFSGAMDISGWLVACWIGVSPVIDLRLPFSIFGFFPFDKEIRSQNNPLALAEHLKGKHLAFYFGNGNKGPLDEYHTLNLPYRFMGWLQEKQVQQMNVAMHEKLNHLNIEHHYKPYGDGMHASAYWKRSLEEELPIVMSVFGNGTAGDPVDASNQ